MLWGESERVCHAIVSNSSGLHGLCQSPLFLEFVKQKYWSGLSFPSPGYLPNSGTGSRALELHANSLPPEPPGKPYDFLNKIECVYGSI